MKATIAYSLLKIAEYKKNDLLLDPFCKTGTISISLLSNLCSPILTHFTLNAVFLVIIFLNSFFSAIVFAFKNMSSSFLKLKLSNSRSILINDWVL
ncbi:hypothetical protein ACFL6I_29510 [candidate division KSB1 bacterium]